jgi:hypothetical protein
MINKLKINREPTARKTLGNTIFNSRLVFFYYIYTKAGICNRENEFGIQKDDADGACLDSINRQPKAPWLLTWTAFAIDLALHE